MPDWANAVVPYRDELRGAAFAVRKLDGSDEVWRILYMVQSPIYIAVVKLTDVEHYHPEMLPYDTVWSILARSKTRRFRVNYASMASAAEMPAVGLADLWLLRNVVYEGGMHMSSTSHRRPLQEFIDLQPGRKARTAAHREQGAAAQKDKSSGQLLKEMHWLQYLEGQEGFDADDDYMGSQRIRHLWRKISCWPDSKIWKICGHL